jgi:hypothetical protein
VKYIKLNFRRRLSNETNAVCVVLKTTHKLRGDEMPERKKNPVADIQRATGSIEATRTVGTTSYR